MIENYFLRWKNKSVFHGFVKGRKQKTSNINLHFYPSHSFEIILSVVHSISQFYSNQTLIVSNLKWHNFSTNHFNPFIITSHSYKSFTSRIEVDLFDIVFIKRNDDFNSCDLFVLVKCVTLIDLNLWTSWALLTVW